MSAAPAMHSDETKARALAIVMHALFIVLLIFGVSWQKKPPVPVEAELWSSLPPLPQPKLQMAPEPEPEPVPRVEPPPVPKAEPVPLPKPEIALKKKPEKEKPKVEPKPEPKAEPKKREDNRAARAQKEAEEKLRREEIEAEQKRLAAEREANAERAAAERVAKAVEAREIQKYTSGIIAKVWARVALPSDLQGNPEAEFFVSLLPGGELENVTMRKSSGNSAYDAAIERAIRQAQPFTVPNGEQFQRNFRRFPMTFRPQR